MTVNVSQLFNSPLSLGMTRAGVCNSVGFPDLRDSDSTAPEQETWLYGDGGLELVFEGDDPRVVSITQRVKTNAGLAVLIGCPVDDLGRRAEELGLGRPLLQEEYCAGRAQEYFLADGTCSIWLLDGLVRSVSMHSAQDRAHSMQD